MYTPVLTSPQEQVLALISAGSTISQAAQSANVHRNTVHNWVRSQADFRLALSHAQYFKALFWREQAEQLASAAVDAIRDTLTGAGLPAAVRLKAAQSILALATTPPPEFQAPNLLDLIATPTLPLQSRPVESVAPVQHAAGCPPGRPLGPAALLAAAEAPVIPPTPPEPASKTVHNSAQSIPDGASTRPRPALPPPGPAAPSAVHNSAQSIQEGRPTPLRSAIQPAHPPSAPETAPNPPQPVRAGGKIGRNDLCPCGSGKKFKRCCLNEDGAAVPSVARTEPRAAA